MQKCALTCTGALQFMHGVYVGGGGGCAIVCAPPTPTFSAEPSKESNATSSPANVSIVFISSPAACCCCDLFLDFCDDLEIIQNTPKQHPHIKRTAATIMIMRRGDLCCDDGIDAGGRVGPQGDGDVGVLGVLVPTGTLISIYLHNLNKVFVYICYTS